MNAPNLWFDCAALNLISGCPSTWIDAPDSTISPTANDPLTIVIGRSLGIQKPVRFMFSMKIKYLVFGFNFLPITSMFLVLQLYNTLISITLSPRLNWSFFGVTSRPNVFSTPFSSIVCFMSCDDVVTIRLPKSWTWTSWLIACSPTTVSTPVHVVSEELNILAAIPPFSPTPKTSARPLYIESIFTISGVSRGISSIQKSVAGFNSIDPT